MTTTIVGILNITPDSFSDGSNYLDPEKAVAHAQKLVSTGAAIVDIGGDSTRPGSKCVGSEEEWRRIGPVVRELSTKLRLSVDTHHAQVASKAIELGVEMINDISAGLDPQMFSLVANSSAKIVLMYSRCPSPHLFEPEMAGDIIENMLCFFSQRINLALKIGVKQEQIILDSGMGAFLSHNPKTSLEVIDRYHELVQLGFPMMFGCSRKGFLKLDLESSIEQRDLESAQIARTLLLKSGGNSPAYIRVHNVDIHSQLLFESTAL